MRVIFLDIDGVLNYWSSKSRCGQWIGIDRKRVKNLAKIVAATDAKIVLTSTWRQYYKLGVKYRQTNKIGKYLYRKLHQENLTIYDMTSEKTAWNHRGFQIQEWLDEHPEVTNYVVLDDELFFDEIELGVINHLIKTIDKTEDEMAGLTDYLATKAIDILNGEAEGPIIDKTFCEIFCEGKTPSLGSLYRL